MHRSVDYFGKNGKTLNKNVRNCGCAVHPTHKEWIEPQRAQRTQRKTGREKTGKTIEFISLCFSLCFSLCSLCSLWFIRVFFWSRPMSLSYPPSTGLGVPRPVAPGFSENMKVVCAPFLRHRLPMPACGDGFERATATEAGRWAGEVVAFVVEGGIVLNRVIVATDDELVDRGIVRLAHHIA